MRHIALITLLATYGVFSGCYTIPATTIFDVSSEKVIIDIHHYNRMSRDKAIEITEDQARAACNAYNKDPYLLSVDKVQTNAGAVVKWGWFSSVVYNTVYRTTWICRELEP